MKSLTSHEAYCAMYAFLEEYYRLTGSDDVGGLLGAMSLLSDGTPADPAIEVDWSNAVSKALTEKVDVLLKMSPGEIGK